MTVWIAVHCPHCYSADVVKYGKSPQGKQRYRCQNSECIRQTFMSDYSYQGYKQEVKKQITTMALNNSGVRDTA